MTIRFKLTTTAVAVILVANSLLSFITLGYISRVWLGEVQTRVHRNLNSAWTAYENYVVRIDFVALLDPAGKVICRAGNKQAVIVIVQQHGGSLEVQSQEGKGTTFTILVPTA